MIRRLALVDRDTARRLVGLALVVLFVVVLVSGFAHAAEAGHGGDAGHDCGLCLALVHIGVALPVVVAIALRRHLEAGFSIAAPLAPARGRRTAHPPPARGPPSRL